MAEFTAVFVEEKNGSVDIKEEDGSVDIKEEDGSVDIKEECEEEKDPLIITSQNLKGKKKNTGTILKQIENSNCAFVLPDLFAASLNKIAASLNKICGYARKIYIFYFKELDTRVTSANILFLNLVT